MCKRIVCLVLFIFAIGVIDTVQAATVFLEDFEGPPAPSGTTALADDLGWTKSGASVGYNTTVPYLDTGAAYQPAANSHHHKAVGAGMVDDIMTLKADLFADNLYETGGEGGVGICDGTNGGVNSFMIGPGGTSIFSPRGGWQIYDGLNDTGFIRVTDGGAPGVGKRFMGGTNVAVTVKVVFDQLANTISVDIIDRATQVSLNPTFVIPLTAGGKTKLQACSSVFLTWNDIHAPNPGLKEVDNISFVSTARIIEFDPPEPDPMTWAQPPVAVDGYSITMTATAATDAVNPPVQYYFECTTDGDASSNWQTDPNYLATGLDPVTEYTFRVKARDNAPSQNETGFSDPCSATTELPTTAGLLLHLDASSLGLSDGVPVETWTSRAGPYAEQFNTSYRPIYRANAFGGRAAVDFDAADDHLFLTSSIANAGSVFAVVKFKSLALPSEENYIVSGNTGERLFWNNNQILVNDAAGFDFNDTDTYHIYTWVQGEKSYLDFTSQDSGIESDTMDGIFIIGAEDDSPLSNVGPDALIAEIIVYDTALGADNRQAIWRYLENKYHMVSTFIVEPAINNYAIQEHKELPVAACRIGTDIRMMACRGEYEPASFVVETDSTLENLMVTVGQLSGDFGATIPSSAVDVRVVQPCWLRITDFPGRMNQVLLHDPSLLIIDHEELVSPFTQGMEFTRTPIDTATLQPADVASRQQFWLTVHVPNDAISGTYTGTISVTSTNAPTQTLTLELDVPDFDLLEPNFEYSLYYATAYYSDQMRINEYENMVAHGCMNPNIYNAEVVDVGDGTLDFTGFAHELSLREQAGMKAAGPLYIVAGTPIHAGNGGAYTSSEVTAMVSEIVTWAQQRGYSDVYFMGNDEATGERLVAQRPTWDAVHAGGGKIFAANFAGFFPYVGDILDCPVITHPAGNPMDVSSHGEADPWLDYVPTASWALDPIDWILDPYTHTEFSPPDYPVLIQNVHNNGFKIFTYMDSSAGRPIPEVHRRLRGLGLYKANLDGTMTWSYNHFLYSPNLSAGPVDWSNLHSFVLRGAEAPFDTLPWEAYREGYDDARYLATLQDAITQCRTSGRRLGRITEVETWLDEIPTDIDLDDWRRQMAIYTEMLLGLDATVTPVRNPR